MTDLRPGLTGTATLTVAPEHTAVQVGSGGIAVFATPMMVALMEKAAVAAVEHLLPAGHHSLGTEIAVGHTAATPVGMAVTATAELTAVDGRRLSFAIRAEDAAGPIGAGTHTRVVVDGERFLARLAARAQGA